MPDRLAIGLLAAASEMEISVGRGGGSRIRVVGHDDHPISRFTSPSLTTIAQDYVAISKTSVETLFDLIASGRTRGARKETLFDGTLVMRASA